MYSWRTIRTACIVLLFLPVVHVAYLISQQTLARLDPSPTAWASEIESYIETDTLQPLPAKPVVVIGGLGVKLWQHLPTDLAPAPVLLRGLGDAIVEDLAFYYARLVSFYQPGAVVLMPSNMEFFIRDNKSAEELVEGIEALIAKDAIQDPARPFYVVTPIKTPLRPQDHATIVAASEQLRTLAQSNSKLTLLDANSTFADAKGNPQPRFFRADGVNLNEQGYLRLTALLKAHLAVNNARNERGTLAL
ncbi:MAG: hypothetical protein AB8C02_08560 [Halioglobus sp.]